MRLSNAMLNALRDADAGVLFHRREDGTFVRQSTVDALIMRDLLSPRFPNEITDEGRRTLVRAERDEAHAILARADSA